jgi:hypothetical protein
MVGAPANSITINIKEPKIEVKKIQQGIIILVPVTIVPGASRRLYELPKPNRIKHWTIIIQQRRKVAKLVIKSIKNELSERTGKANDTTASQQRRKNVPSQSTDMKQRHHIQVDIIRPKFVSSSHASGSNYKR